MELLAGLLVVLALVAGVDGLGRLAWAGASRARRRGAAYGWAGAWLVASALLTAGVLTGAHAALSGPATAPAPTAERSAAAP